jgi:hypothetical protein
MCYPFDFLPEDPDRTFQLIGSTPQALVLLRKLRHLDAMDSEEPLDRFVRAPADVSFERYTSPTPCAAVIRLCARNGLLWTGAGQVVLHGGDARKILLAELAGRDMGLVRLRGA